MKTSETPAFPLCALPLKSAVSLVTPRLLLLFAGLPAYLTIRLYRSRPADSSERVKRLKYVGTGYSFLDPAPWELGSLSMVARAHSGS